MAAIVYCIYIYIYIFQLRNRGDPREIVGYHDLDAPEDLDLF